MHCSQGGHQGAPSKEKDFDVENKGSISSHRRPASPLPLLSFFRTSARDVQGSQPVGGAMATGRYGHQPRDVSPVLMISDTSCPLCIRNSRATWPSDTTPRCPLALPCFLRRERAGVTEAGLRHHRDSGSRRQLSGVAARLG